MERCSYYPSFLTMLKTPPYLLQKLQSPICCTRGFQFRKLFSSSSFQVLGLEVKWQKDSKIISIWEQILLVETHLLVALPVSLSMMLISKGCHSTGNLLFRMLSKFSHHLPLISLMFSCQAKK